MIRPQLTLDLHSELIVDNFAGGGGASTGIELALGRQVDHAINHDWAALGMHRINHPQTVHHCEDVFDIDPLAITEGRPTGLGWFSPDCKHFSKAKGGRPLSKKIRGLAFVMLRWAKIRTRVIYMENVEEIQTWGPLLEDGRPDPKHKGRTWRALLDALGPGLDPEHPDLQEMLEVLGDTVTRDELERGFGYDIETREIRAFRHGTPTIRKRLYLVGRCDGQPIVWPEPTHARPDEAKKLGLKPWRTVAECIDWSIPCHSIFLTREDARKFRCKRPLATSSLRRIATGMDRYVLKAKRPYLVSLTHQGGDRVESVDEPARTLTGAHRGEKAVVTVNIANSKTTGRGPNAWPVDEPGRTVTSAPGFTNVEASIAPILTEHANASAQRTFAPDEPLRTQCGEVKGGHFAAVTASVTRFQGDHAGRSDGAERNQDAEAPLSTQDTSNRFGVVTATLVRDFGESIGQPVTEPAPTVMPHGHGKSKIVTATIVGAGGPVYSGKPKPIDQPMNAQTTGNHSAVAVASVVKLRGTNVGHGADEPTHTASAGGTHHGIVAASIVQTGYGEREGQAPRALDIEKPAGTAVAGGCKQALSLAYLAQHNAGNATNPGHPSDEPTSTISSKGSQQQVVCGSIIKYYGTEQDPRMDEPCHSTTTKARFGVTEANAVTYGLTPEQLAGAYRVAAFLREYGVEFEGEFATVTVDGIAYVIVDISMRMLTPRELFRAQGFPEDYVIDRAWVVDPKTGSLKEVPLTKEQQIRMCGNSVCPPVARALIRANNPELMAWEKHERMAA